MAGYAPGGFSPEFSDDFVRGVDSSYLCKTGTWAEPANFGLQSAPGRT